MKGKVTRPYGSWRSINSAANVAKSGMGSNLLLSEFKLDGGNVYWLERDSEHDGTRNLLRRSSDGAITTLGSAPFNVRTRMHEYGGGSYCIWKDVVFFSNVKDQRLYRVEYEKPYPITPLSNDGRYADIMATQDGSQIIAMQERHTAHYGIRNELVAVLADGSAPPRILATGR